MGRAAKREDPLGFAVPLPYESAAGGGCRPAAFSCAARGAQERGGIYSAEQRPDQFFAQYAGPGNLPVCPALSEKPERAEGKDGAERGKEDKTRRRREKGGKFAFQIPKKGLQ